MGEGILPTEEVVKWRDGESLDLGSLLSASSGSQGISAGPGMGMAACGWKGVAATESPESWCREASHCRYCRHSRL